MAGRLKSLGNLKYFKSAKNAVKEFLAKTNSGKYLRVAQPGFIDISSGSKVSKAAKVIGKQKSNANIVQTIATAETEAAVTALSKVRFTTTHDAAQEVAKWFGSAIKPANGNGWRVTINKGKKSFVIRIMEAGSGGRKDPYFRIGIPGKGALTKEGALVLENKALDLAEFTHIDLTDNYLSQINNMINLFLQNLGKK